MPTKIVAASVTRATGSVANRDRYARVGAIAPSRRRAPVRGPRLRDLPGDRRRRRLPPGRPVLPLRPAPRGRARRRPRGRPAAGRRRTTSWRTSTCGRSAARRSPRRRRRPQAPRRSTRSAPTGSRSPTCRRATRSSSRSRWPGPRCSGAADIFIGVNALDYSGYPDCRPEYIAAFERLANLATRAGVEGDARSRSTRR